MQTRATESKKTANITISSTKMRYIDFMSDVLTNQRRFRTLIAIDDFNWEAIAIEVAHSMSALIVTALMEQIIYEHRKPKCIWVTMDQNLYVKNLISGVRATVLKISLPNLSDSFENDYIERFN